MPTNIQLYDRLLETPLFQGLSTEDLKSIIGHTKFDFKRFQQGKCIKNEGERCDGLHFLLQGTMEVKGVSSDHSFSLTEFTTAPFQLEPERLFGLHQYHAYTYTAATDCSFMILSKEEITKLLDGFMVFRINYINIISSRLQKFEENVWYTKNLTLYDRILLFFVRHCIRPAGEKHINIKMTKLAEELGTSRLNVSKELNAMKSKGLITLSRGKIIIPGIERLFM